MPKQEIQFLLTSMANLALTLFALDYVLILQFLFNSIVFIDTNP